MSYREKVEAINRTFTRLDTTQGMSLLDARQHVQANLADGTTCPCCDQYCKLYERKLYSTIAAGLIWLVRTFRVTGDWIDLPATAPRFVLRTGGQFALLAHWGLIEQRPNEDETKRCSGQWRPTQQGIAFVDQKASVPAYVHLYNNQVRGFSEKHTDILTALGERFDYRELMGWGGDDE